MSGSTSEDRRRDFRLALTAPLRGRVGSTRVFISDVSARGLRIIHADRLPRVGETFQLIVEREQEGIALQCEVRRTQVRTSGGTEKQRLFESGLCVAPSENRSLHSLSELFLTEGQRSCNIPR
jgi:hypothetical protein